jgi:hypothetical protein
VAARYLLARGILAPDVQRIEALVRQKSYDDALAALDAFLIKQLKVHVTKSSDRLHVLTEWVHALDDKDQGRFETIVTLLGNLRYALRHDRDDTEVMWKSIDRIKDELPWLEDLARGQDDEFKHGPFTIILTKGAEGGLDEAIAALDAAASKIRPKFPKVLYGKVYVRRGLRGDSPHESGGQVAGVYVPVTDAISLSLYATPDRDSIKTLIHEFGHRHHTRFSNGDQREKFIELSTVGDVQRSQFPLAERQRLATEYMALLREHQKEHYPDSETFLSERAQLWFTAFPRDEWRNKVVPLVKRFRDDGDNSVAEALERALSSPQYGGDLTVVLNEGKYHPLAASLYGETKWTENWAESFLATVLGLSLPAPLQVFMDAL